MIDADPLVTTIHDRYPEGLTGIFAVGGTRTTYILEQNRTTSDPGHIRDFAAYADFLLDRYLALIEMYLDLGGQNLIMEALSFQSFYERGEGYAELIALQGLLIINEKARAFYREHAVDPYFVGIDTLLQLPESLAAHRLGEQLAEFQRTWPYQNGRRKVLWEIAPIPLYSFWKADLSLDDAARAALETELAAAPDMESMYRLLYRHYARAAYGTEVPMPHFYVGTNRNGDLKLRSPMPLALSCGGPLRLFYTPYPSLWMTHATLKAILEDLTSGTAHRSFQVDYRGHYTAEVFEAEYQRFRSLSADATSTVGLFRKAPRSNGS